MTLKIDRRHFLAGMTGLLFFPFPSFSLAFPSSEEDNFPRAQSNRSSRKKGKGTKTGTISSDLERALLVRSNPHSFRMKVAFNAKISGTLPEEINVALPVPETNEYQEIDNIEYPAGCRYKKFKENGSRYILMTFTDTNPFRPFSLSYDATVYDIFTDFSRIKTIHKYDRNSEVFRKYTGGDGSIVDPKNMRIRQMAEEISAQSSNSLEFAYYAYLYISSHFKYRNPELNMLPLTSVLEYGGGHCGNLTSIYVSLLRSQGIPARHLIGKRAGSDSNISSCHIWSDFYLQEYGWIPVDISQRTQAKDKLDWFGKVNSQTGLIVSKGVELSVDLGNARKKVHSLQNYFINYRYLQGSVPQIDCSLNYVKQ